VPHGRGENPFSLDGIERDARGIPYYSGLPATLADVLREHARARPSAEALCEIGGERLTHAEVWERASRVAGGLRARGVATGDRVAIAAINGVRWVLAFYGAMLAGAVPVPVNTRFSEAEVGYVVEDSGARVVYRTGEELPDGEPYVDTSAKADTLAAIFYTSGTTGFPKGAMTSHRAFLTNCENMVRCLDIPHDLPLRTLLSVPLFHVTGCNSQLLTALYLGGSSVILPALDLGVLIGAMASERVDQIVTVPAVYALLLNHPAFASADVSNVRFAGYGGAPIAPALVHRIKAAFPNARVGNGFGMTEGAALMTALPHEYADAHADSVGFACPSMDLALFEPDQESGVGELLVRGANVTSGYWNKPEATADALVDGWLHTGDLARIDERGLTYIVDRKKDMICRGGENVYCVEVENAFAGIAGIAEVAVLPVPDDVMGEKVGVVIVPLAGAEVDVPAVIAGLKEKIADFKIPQFAVLRAQPLPRNAGGKVLKAELKAAALDWGRPLR
jgi:acyl-CoA synthetase (AMP-forming)/AMP-acid ligase II